MYHAHQGTNVNRNIPVEAHTIDPQHQLPPVHHRKKGNRKGYMREALHNKEEKQLKTEKGKKRGWIRKGANNFVFKLPVYAVVERRSRTFSLF